MTLEELDREIAKKKRELRTSREEEAYNYIVDFTKQYKVNKVTDFLDVDIWKFITCNLYIQSNKSIDELIRVVLSIKPLFMSMKPLSISRLLQGLDKLVNEDKTDIVIDYFKCNDENSEQKYLNIIKNVDSNLVSALTMMKQKMIDGKIDVLPFFEYLIDCGSELIFQMLLYCVYHLMETTDADVVMIISGDEEENRRRKERKIELISQSITDDVTLTSGVKFYKQLLRYIEEYERDEKRKQRELDGIELARNLLIQNIGKKEIVLYRDIVKLIKDVELKYCFLLFMEEYNSQYYHELEEELKVLQKDSKIFIQALLKKYGIRKELYDIDLMMQYKGDELEEILSLVSQLSISQEEKVLVIYNTSLESVRLLKEYVRRNILTMLFISNHLELLKRDNQSLGFLNENIKALKDFGITPYIFKDNMNLFLNNSEMIRENLMLLNTYHLLSSLNTTGDFRFLLNPFLVHIIDKIIEYGFEDYLISNLSILNTGCVKRLDILKVMHIPILSKEQLLEVLDDNRRFFVSNDNIDAYLEESDLSLEEELSLDDLNQYISSDRLYDFDGVKISINKVERMMKKGLSLSQAIGYDLIIDDEEINKIKKLLTSERKKKTLD